MVRSPGTLMDKYELCRDCFYDRFKDTHPLLVRIDWLKLVFIRCTIQIYGTRFEGNLDCSGFHSKTLSIHDSQ